MPLGKTKTAWYCTCGSPLRYRSRWITGGVLYRYYLCEQCHQVYKSAEYLIFSWERAGKMPVMAEDLPRVGQRRGAGTGSRYNNPLLTKKGLRKLLKGVASK